MSKVEAMKKRLFKFERRSPLVLGILVSSLPIAAYFIAQIWWLYGPFVDPSELKARQLAGLGAINCGSVKTYDSNSERAHAKMRAMDACMVDAFRSRRAFIGHETREGLPGSVDEYTVGTTEGRVYSISSIFDTINGKNSTTESTYVYRTPVVKNDPWPKIVENF